MSAAAAVILALLAVGVVVCGILMQALERQIAYEALRRAAPPSATGSATIGYGVTGESADVKPYPTTSAPEWDEPRDEPPAHKGYAGSTNPRDGGVTVRGHDRSGRSDMTTIPANEATL